MSLSLHDVQTLIDFHYWARDRALAAAAALTPEQWTRDLGSSFRSVRDTLVHTYSAEWNWLLRLNGTSPTSMLSADAYPDLDTLRRDWIGHEHQLRHYVANVGEEGMQRVVAYKSLAGQPSETPCWQILQHLVNHATYHRGQFTTLLRQMGAAPAKSMDLIAFYREHPGR